MIEPAHLAVTRAAYDAVADSYADRIPPLFDAQRLDRAMLAAFAERVGDIGPVADLGCGPGHVTERLHAFGADVFGVDLSPRMVAIARHAYPHLRFDVGSMAALALPDESLGGGVAWYSTIHTPPGELPSLFAEFHRVLVPGGHALLAFQTGDDERLHREQAYGHPVSYDVCRLSPDRAARRLEEANLPVYARLMREPEDWKKVPQCYLMARRHM